MFCKECGFQLSDDSKFCPNCGTEVESSVMAGISSMAQKAEWGDLEEDNSEEIDIKEKLIDKLDKAGKWSGVVNHSKTIVNTPSEPIIETIETNVHNILLKHDKSTSSYWYVNQSNKSLSDDYEWLGTKINKFVCAQINGSIGLLEQDKNNQFNEVKNSFIFDNVGWNEWYTKEEFFQYVHLFKFKNTENFNQIITESGKYCIVKHHNFGDCVITDNLEVYAIKKDYTGIIIGLVGLILILIATIPEFKNLSIIGIIIEIIVLVICVVYMLSMMNISYKLEQVFHDLRNRI